MLSNESGYCFVVKRWSDDKIIAVYDQVEVAVQSLQLSWMAEIRWSPDTLPLAMLASCLATRKPLAIIVKVPIGRVPLALVL